MENQELPRGLFRHLRTNRKSIPAPVSNETELVRLSEIKKPRQLSRRQVISVFSGIGAAIAAGTVASQMKRRQEGEFLPQNKVAPGASAEGWEFRPGEHLGTVAEQGLLMAAATVAHAVFVRLGIPHGNRSIPDEQLLQLLRDGKGVVTNVLLAPALEESVLRLLPSLAVDKWSSTPGGTRWDVGIPVALLFALIHNAEQDEAGKYQWNLGKSVPLHQFMLGLFCWYLIRTRGFSHAVLAHTFNNGVAVGIGSLLFRIFPEPRALALAKDYIR